MKRTQINQYDIEKALIREVENALLGKVENALPGEVENALSRINS